jgi:hypothetical protein
VEDGVLNSENLQEFFLAFVGTGNFVPSRKLLAALAEAAGRSEGGESPGRFPILRPTPSRTDIAAAQVKGSPTLSTASDAAHPALGRQHPVDQRSALAR